MNLEALLLATGNENKVRELRPLFAPLGLALCAIDDGPQPEETGETFAANALIKALASGRRAAMATLADDSGLEVEALGGAPGVHSARFGAPFAAGVSRDVANNEKLLQALAGCEERRARFCCALALVVPRSLGEVWVASGKAEAGRVAAAALPDSDWMAWLFHGYSRGTILTSGRGENGFGYDPLFLSADLGRTFAEATREEKEGVSHRGRAVAQVLSFLDAVRSV